MFVFLTMPTLYLDGRLTGFAKATKTCPAHKLYWRPLNWKRSLPVLKWTSESEYFLSFEIFFADTIYNPVQEQSLNPFAAHARHGVTTYTDTTYTDHSSPQQPIFTIYFSTFSNCQDTSQLKNNTLTKAVAILACYSNKAQG